MFTGYLFSNFLPRRVPVYTSLSDLRWSENPNGFAEDFIVSSGEPVSMEELARLSIETTGKGTIEKLNKNSRSFSLTSNTSKISKYLNWQPNDNIEIMISDIAMKISKADKNDN